MGKAKGWPLAFSFLVIRALSPTPSLQGIEEQKNLSSPLHEQLRSFVRLVFHILLVGHAARLSML
jgi:hypothetical protein